MADENGSSRGYLQQFGPIEVTELGTRTVSGEQIVEDIQEIRRAISALERQMSPPREAQRSGVRAPHYVVIDDFSEDARRSFIDDVRALSSVKSVAPTSLLGRAMIQISPSRDRSEMMSDVKRIKAKYGVPDLQDLPKDWSP